MSSKLYSPEDFWTKVNRDINQAAYESTGKRMVVDSVTNNLVRLQTIEGQPGGVGAYLGIQKLSPGDEVWVEPVASITQKPGSKMQNWIVVGPVQRVASGVRKIDGTDLILVGGMDLKGASDAAGSVIKWSVDGATGDATFGDVTGKNATFEHNNSPVVMMSSQSASDTSSTTSTSVYSQAVSTSITLPAGNWTIRAMGFVDLKHSADDDISMLTEIDGISGTARTLLCSSTVYRGCRDDQKVDDVVGSRSVSVRVMFRSNVAGTTTASNPCLIIIAWRTS